MATRTSISTIKRWYNDLNEEQISFLKGRMGYLPDTTDNNSLREFFYDVHGIRVCSICGSEMQEGYYFENGFFGPNYSGFYTCSDECLLKAYNGDKKEMESDRELACIDDAVFFYTEWYDDDLCDDLEKYADVVEAISA